MKGPFFVYIVASKLNGTLYTGMTNNLIRRMDEHKNERAEGFTKKYGCKTLVYFEATEDYEGALRREKTIKKWPRKWKLNVINEKNPDWNDLYDSICK